jgi:hypothetical protein
MMEVYLHSPIRVHTDTYTVKLFISQYFVSRVCDKLDALLNPIMFMRILTSVSIFGFSGFNITVSLT